MKSYISADIEGIAGIAPWDEARIREGMQAALGGDRRACLVDLPSHFHLEIEDHRPTVAHGQSFYPGARLQDKRTASFESDDYSEILRAVRFLI